MPIILTKFIIFDVRVFLLISYVALWGQAAKADESVLARNQTKDSWT